MTWAQVSDWDKLTQHFAEFDRLSQIVRQVDDVLTVNWITVKDGDYRRALNDLVAWNIQLHDDPAVSPEAALREAALKQLRLAAAGAGESFVGRLIQQALDKLSPVPENDWSGWMRRYGRR